MDKLNQGFENYIPTLEDLSIRIGIALAILIGGWMVSSYLGKVIKRGIERSSRIDNTIIPVVRATVVWSIRCIVIIMVMSQFGIRTTGLIAALGAAGIALGLALQGTLQNIAAGIMLLCLRPMRAEDFVTISNVTGTVKEIGLFLTRIEQADGITISVPNSNVWNNTIINFSQNGKRRMDIPVGISYGDDLDKAAALLSQLAQQTNGVLDEPLPEVFVSEYRESTILMTLRVWTYVGRFTNVQSELMKTALQTLEKAGYMHPIPAKLVYPKEIIQTLPNNQTKS